MLRSAMVARGYAVRIDNDFKLSLVHPEHPQLFVDIDVVRPYRDGGAITYGPLNVDVELRQGPADAPPHRAIA